jgi:thioredoxin-related protein
MCLFLLCWVFPDLVHASALLGDTIPASSLVFVEGEDPQGRVLNRCMGVIVKDGFVALNYHVVAGMSKVKAYRHGDPNTYVSDGYLTVDETKDLIVVSLPGIKGPPARIEGLVFPEKGKKTTLISNSGNRKYKSIEATVSGSKDLGGVALPELVSAGGDDWTNGPVFFQGGVAGFITAGYSDGKHYAYAIPGSELRRLLNRSFIIKDYASLRDNKPLTGSSYQKILMESLSSVIWMSVEEAEQRTQRKPRMIVMTVTTKWAGWGKLQERNFKSKRIIRYLNENYYTVKLDAESSDTILFNRVNYTRGDGMPYHMLAYSLLEGQMDFPSTVFLDEKMTVLMVIPGPMDEERFDVVLHYFAEKAYNNTKLSFRDYEIRYLESLEN